MTGLLGIEFGVVVSCQDSFTSQCRGSCHAFFFSYFYAIKVAFGGAVFREIFQKRPFGENEKRNFTRNNVESSERVSVVFPKMSVFMD